MSHKKKKESQREKRRSKHDILQHPLFTVSHPCNSQSESERVKEHTKQKLPWWFTERAVRTTQPPPRPPTKCMESHKHKDACFSSSWLNKKQKPWRKPRVKLPWMAGLQALVPAVRDECQREITNSRHGCGYPNIKGLLHLHMDNCAVMHFITGRPDGSNGAHPHLPVSLKVLTHT